MILGIIWFLLVVLIIVSFWIIFSKAGFEGYEILILGHNVVVLLEIAKKPKWWFFLFLIPVVNIVFAIMMYHAISLNFGKSAGFTVGMILLPIVFIPILAFGDAKYEPIVGEVKVEIREEPKEEAKEE